MLMIYKQFLQAGDASMETALVAWQQHHIAMETYERRQSGP